MAGKKQTAAKPEAAKKEKPRENAADFTEQDDTPILVSSGFKSPRTFAYSTDTVRPDNHTETLILLPGMQLLEGEEARKFRTLQAAEGQNKKFRMAIEDGTLRIVTGTDGEELSKYPKDLTGMDPKLALDLVGGTGDLPLLKRWAKAETRNVLIGALKGQITKLQNLEKKLAATEKA